MKSFLFFLAVIVVLEGVGQMPGYNDSHSVPAELVTDDSTYWTVSTLSTMGYVNTTPGAYYNTYKSGGGMLVKLKFKKGNRFELQVYIQAHTYGVENETWTRVEGSVAFTKDAKNQPVFITKAEKGVYRINRNGERTSRAITAHELQTQHSNMYLWEKALFADDPGNAYLLVVDLDAHPAADVNKLETIDPLWVSKFHIPIK